MVVSLPVVGCGKRDLAGAIKDGTAENSSRTLHFGDEGFSPGLVLRRVEG